jgi:ABC-type transport system involved in multi-copper enzyme maturation permease subunit
MMLFYKAWRESRTRFALSGLALCGCCGVFVLYVGDVSYGIGETSGSYLGYIWHITYKSYLKDLFILLALLLGAGGLLREREYRTAGFTLALPVSRWRLLATRAAVGIAEIGLLSLLPGLVISSLSPVIHRSYPLSQALEFSLLWTICGAFIFMIGFLSSVVFSGEFTAPLVALFSLLIYSAIVDIPAVDRYVADILDIMSGEGMPYFRQDTFLFTGPLPWSSLAIIVLLSFAMLAVAARTTRRQDF